MKKEYILTKEFEVLEITTEDTKEENGDASVLFELS